MRSFQDYIGQGQQPMRQPGSKPANYGEFLGRALPVMQQQAYQARQQQQPGWANNQPYTAAPQAAPVQQPYVPPATTQPAQQAFSNANPNASFNRPPIQQPVPQQQGPQPNQNAYDNANPNARFMRPAGQQAPPQRPPEAGLPDHRAALIQRMRNGLGR